MLRAKAATEETSLRSLFFGGFFKRRLTAGFTTGEQSWSLAMVEELGVVADGQRSGGDQRAGKCVSSLRSRMALKMCHVLSLLDGFSAMTARCY